MEMNTRVQVEHPVTEMVTGMDIVNEQIRFAAGSPLRFTQDDIKISRRMPSNAASTPNTRTIFSRRPARIAYFHPPGGLGVRVDSRVPGYVILPHYDSLVGKLIVHGRTRTEALMRLRRALDEFVVEGVETTLPLFRDARSQRRRPERPVRHPLA